MAILDVDGKILITRRPKSMRNFPWAWVLPGGHIELGESMEESVIREIEEETGISIKQIDKTKCVYDNKECILEPFFLFESVSMKAKGTVAPHNGHLVVFYKI